MSAPHIIGLQLDLAWENAAANREHAASVLSKQPPPRESLVVLPEMFSSGFSMVAEKVAEPAGGPTERWLSDTARDLGTWLLAGVARRDGKDTAANEALTFDPSGTLVTTYRKQRPFRPGGEHQHYAAGDSPRVFKWAGISVAPFICYDLRFPELFRVAARERPELFVVVANWPDKRIAQWVKLLQARAIENQAYVIGVNRVGDDPVHHYVGRSVIVNPWGDIIADAGTTEGRLEADLDLDVLRDYRTKLPFLADLES